MFIFLLYDLMMLSENHRMVEVGKDLQRSSAPTHCSGRDT